MGDEGGSTIKVTEASRKIFLTLAVKPSDLQDQLEYSFQRFVHRYHEHIFITVLFVLTVHYRFMETLYLLRLNFCIVICLFHMNASDISVFSS